MALFNSKAKEREEDPVGVGLYQSEYQKYSLEPMQTIAYESVPKDTNGIPFGIIGRTSVTFDGDNYNVDIYNDTEHNEGACVLPDGTRGKIPNEAYQRFLKAFDEQMTLAKREAATGKTEYQFGAEQGQVKKKLSKGEKAEAKKRKKEQDEANATVKDYKKDKNKKTIALLVYIIAVIVIVLLARFLINAQANTVDVIRLTQDMLSGDVITEDSIEAYSMLENVYETLGKSTYVSDGKSVTTQTMLTWDQRDQVLGKYMTCYTQAGQILTSRHVTEETTTRNPWLAVAEPGQEVYTMSFNAGDVNTSLLYPGCHMRVRLVVNLDADEYSSYKTNQTDSEVADIAVAEEESADTNLEAETEQGGVAGLLEEAKHVAGINVLNEDSLVEHSNEVPVVEVVFNDLQAIDMLNSSNQSIYELYMALLKLPLDERVAYLNTKLTNNDTANNFRTLVTPTRLVFLLSEEQANMLAQFENVTNANFKFTILLAEGEDDNIVSSFIDISSQIQNTLEENN